MAAVQVIASATYFVAGSPWEDEDRRDFFRRCDDDWLGW
jgi:hypothetical protein